MTLFKRGKKQASSLKRLITRVKKSQQHKSATAAHTLTSSTASHVSDSIAEDKSRSDTVKQRYFFSLWLWISAACDSLSLSTHSETHSENHLCEGFYTGHCGVKHKTGDHRRRETTGYPSQTHLCSQVKTGSLHTWIDQIKQKCMFVFSHARGGDFLFFGAVKPCGALCTMRHPKQVTFTDAPVFFHMVECIQSVKTVCKRPPHQADFKSIWSQITETKGGQHHVQVSLTSHSPISQRPPTDRVQDSWPTKERSRKRGGPPTSRTVITSWIVKHGAVLWLKLWRNYIPAPAWRVA